MEIRQIQNMIIRTNTAAEDEYITVMLNIIILHYDITDMFPTFPEKYQKQVWGSNYNVRFLQ